MTHPHSKFDPTPQANSVPVATPPPPRPAKKKRAAQSAPRKASFLKLDEGYQIKLKPDSGYRIFLKLMAEKGNFSEVAKTLAEGVDASDPAQATGLLQKMMVRRSAIEEVLRADPKWIEHGTRRVQRLRERALGGDSSATRTLANPRRVKDGRWVGDIREMMSVCCGAYENRNRNVDKFDDASLTFRKFPLHPTRDEPVYLMFFPSRYVPVVVEALRTVYGDKASDENIPEKYA